MDITAFRSQLSIALGRVSLKTQGVRSSLTKLRARAVQNADQLRFALQRDLRGLQTVSRHAMLFAYGQAGEFASQLSVVLEHARAKIRRLGSAAAKSVRNAGSKTRRLREARCAKENHLRNMVAISPEATVVTDCNRRLVIANLKALDLLGISECNASKFSIDAFIAYGQIAGLTENGVLFREREKRHGKCKIRRLDGSLRLAQYLFLPNVVPHLDLYKFMNAVPYRLAPPAFAASETRELSIQPRAASNSLAGNTRSIKGFAGRT